MSSTAELLLIGLERLATNAAFWIVSSNQSTYTGSLVTGHIQLLKLVEVLGKLISHYYRRFFFFFLLS